MKTHFVNFIKQTIRFWYLPLIVGFVLLLMGLWTFAKPVESYLALSFLFGITFLISGIIETFYSIINFNVIDHWGWSLFVGLITIFIGLALVIDLGLSATSLPYYLAFVILFRSLGAIGSAFEFGLYDIVEWRSLLFFGILGTLCTCVLIWNPVLAGMTIIFWSGFSFIVTALFNIVFAIKLRKLNLTWQKISSQAQTEYELSKKEIERNV